MGAVFNNFGWKLLALIVSFGLWLLVMSSNSIEITKEVQLNLQLPAGLVAANDIPPKVSFRLQGSKLFLQTLANNLDAIQVDLSQAKPGPAYYRIERDSLRLPIGIKVLSISPSSINPLLEPVLAREVPVQVTRKNDVPAGYRLVRLQAVPAQVKIKGPKSQVEKISVLKTTPVELADLPSSLKWELPLTPPTGQIKFDESDDPKIVVEVEPKGSNFRVAGVAVQGGNQAALSPDKVTLYVSCPANLIKSLTPDHVRVSVAVQGLAAGTYLREVKVDLPAGVRLVRVVPDRIQIRVE